MSFFGGGTRPGFLIYVWNWNQDNSFFVFFFEPKPKVSSSKERTAQHRRKTYKRTSIRHPMLLHVCAPPHHKNGLLFIKKQTGPFS
jgi:hypothetical protein